ncbi:unnamed protein product [Polarella glacialis]|uniref:J domain-containing protein n=1 Tax=Polarella glacialis TaxID=89957 RepID=A0A813DWP7_POLGL|nr:unnamed protein product [Polarella glacialis]
MPPRAVSKDAKEPAGPVPGRKPSKDVREGENGAAGRRPSQADAAKEAGRAKGGASPRGDPIPRAAWLPPEPKPKPSQSQEPKAAAPASQARPPFATLYEKAGVRFGFGGRPSAAPQRGEPAASRPGYPPSGDAEASKAPGGQQQQQPKKTHKWGFGGSPKAPEAAPPSRPEPSKPPTKQKPDARPDAKPEPKKPKKEPLPKEAAGPKLPRGVVFPEAPQALQAARALFAELESLKARPAAERRKAYRNACLRWHPDKNIDDEDTATDVFQFLQALKDWCLSD